MTSDDTFQALFDRFRSMLAPYAAEFFVADDHPGFYAIDMAPPETRDPTTWFAGARLGKRYVSYYLMPVYVRPDLLDGISPELRKRMQGKSCFNFAKVDEPLLAELEGLTRTAYEATASDPHWGKVQRGR